MTPSDPRAQDFDAEEWRASAKDGPTFEFERGTATEIEPDFEPTQPPPSFADEEDEHRSAWRSAEFPRDEAHRPRSAEAHRPGMPSVEDRNFAMISHAAGAVGFLVTGGLIGWLVPLILYLVKKDDGGFAAHQSLEALNFQITIWIVLLFGGVLSMILIGIPIVLAALACEFICSILGAVRTYRGEAYTYPINFRLISNPAA